MKTKIAPTLYPKFFASLRRAASTLGYTSREAQERYYKAVLDETAHCSSIKQLPSLEAFDACLARFAVDSQNYRVAVDAEMEKQKRRAYVVKVMAIQIMQLKGYDGSAPTDDENATNGFKYLDAILKQCRASVGFYAKDSSFWMDLSPGSLLLVMRILDSHLRKLKRQHFPTFPLSFSDRIRYQYYYGSSGATIFRELVDKHYYQNLPFGVIF